MGELVFFTRAGVGLCFWFVLQTALITQGCFSCCWAGLVQSFSASHPTSKQVHKELIGDSARTAGERRKKRFGMMVFVFLRHHEAWWKPDFLEIETLEYPWEAVNEFLVLLVCMDFVFPTELPLSRPVSFLTFTLPILSHILTQGQWVSGCVGFSCTKFAQKE